MAELSMRRSGVYAARGDFGFGGFQAPTGSMTGVGTGGGTLASILGAASSLIGPLLQRSPSPAPSMNVASLFPTTGLLGSNTIGSSINALLGTGGAEGGLFGTTAERVRPMRNVPVTGPDGRLYWFGYLGKPVLWSGDVAAARRVQRVARRAGRAASRRRSLRRRR